jgi:hypothetical protein
VSDACCTDVPDDVRRDPDNDNNIILQIQRPVPRPIRRRELIVSDGNVTVSLADGNTWCPECREGAGDPDVNGCRCAPTDDVTVSATLHIGFIVMVWTFRGGTETATINFGGSLDCYESAIKLPEASGGENWYDLLHGVIIKTVC